MARKEGQLIRAVRAHGLFVFHLAAIQKRESANTTTKPFEGQMSRMFTSPITRRALV
jgi:hypothetical protein